MKNEDRAPGTKLLPALSPDTSVKVVGLGGVGGPVAQNLSIFLGSHDQDSRLVLIDGDSFEEGNASRMLFTECGNKAEVICSELRPHFQHRRLSIVPIGEYVTAGNIGRLVGRVGKHHAIGLSILDTVLIQHGNKQHAIFLLH